MAFNGKCLFLVTCIVASMIKSSVGECTSELRNHVLREGESLKFDVGNNQNCRWWVCPSNEVFNIKKDVTSELGRIDPKYGSSYSLEGNSLVMNSANSQPGESPYSTAGVYIAQCENDCITAAKVVVIQSGPTCSCYYDKDNKQTVFTVTIIYADTAKNDMYPKFSCSQKGVPTHSAMPRAERKDKYRFSATTTYKIKGKYNGAGKEIKCTVTFARPSKWPIPNVNQEEPDYTDSCSFDKTCN